ncbi:MAG TPA: ECF transporter S component [Candidatus Dormibacteraeota bacterium]|nr:ECF transporter S component [Candidatus Dormibacteraeota bacterium]
MTAWSQSRDGWRVVDIVVAAVLAVTFGAVFQAWNLLWAASGPAFAAFPPLQGFMYGIWLLPAVLVPLIVRRPGAALLGEGIAASVSALMGAQWGLLTIVYGLMQGGAAELIFAFGLYRRWGLPTALLAGAAAGAAAVLLDLVLFYPNWAASWQVAFAGLVIPSAALIAGLGSWLLVRALARAGVLSAFPSGGEQPEV